MKDNSPNLVIDRKSLRVNRLRKYKLIIDDKEVHYIKNGETLSLKLPTGEHGVYAKIDWLKSNRVNFCIDTNNQVNLIIGIKKSKFITIILSIISMIGVFWIGAFLTDIFNNRLFLYVVGCGGLGLIFGYLTSIPSIVDQNNSSQ
jgi:hypothetical protein